MDSFTKLIETFLFYISNFLYIPVILSVAVLCLYVVLQLGTFVREWLERRQNHFLALEQYKNRLQQELHLMPPKTSESLKHAHIERLLQITELENIARLDKVRFMIRTGPALGLMGTLIPMGTSLAALAEGNIPNMASNMVTAFTATVAGLGCSVVAYLISVAREKWLRADIREMEFHTEVVMQGGVSQPPVQPYSAQHQTDVLSEELAV